MKGFNRVILIGNLGRDPEFQYIGGTTAIARFPIATTEIFKDKDGNPARQTEWHSVVLWRGLAELARRCLRKGSHIFVEGKLHNRTLETDRNVRYTLTEVVAETFIMLDKKKDLSFDLESHSGTELNKNQQATRSFSK